MSSEDWRTVLNSIHTVNQKEAQEKARKIAEQQRKMQEAQEAKAFVVQIAGGEFYPLLVDLRKNIPFIQSAKKSEIVTNVDPNSGTAFLCLLWGERIGLETLDQMKLKQFLAENEKLKSYAKPVISLYEEKRRQIVEEVKAMYQSSVLRWFGSKREVSKRMEIDINIQPPAYDIESTPVFDCSYLSVFLQSDEKQPANPSIELGNTETRYVEYVKDKDKSLMQLGEYLRNPKKLLKKISCSDYPPETPELTKEIINHGQNIPGILIQDVLNGKGSLSLERGFSCYHSSCYSCNACDSCDSCNCDGR